MTSSTIHQLLDLQLQLLKLRRSDSDSRRSEVLGATIDVAVTLLEMNRVGEAVSYLEEANASLVQNGVDQNWSATVLLSLYASGLEQLGDYKLAIPVRRRLVDSQRNQHGSDSSQALEAMSDLADDLWESNQLAEAKQWQQLVYETRLEKFGAEDPETMDAAVRLSATLAANGDLHVAKQLLEMAFKFYTREYGLEDQGTLTVGLNLLDTYRRLQLADMETSLHTRLTDTLQRVTGDPLHDAEINDLIATVKDLDAAEVLKTYGDDGYMHQPPSDDTLEDGDCSFVSRHSRILGLQESILEIIQSELPGLSDLESMLGRQLDIAMTLWRIGRYKDARALEESTLERATTTLGRHSPVARWAMSSLADSLEWSGDAQSALSLRRELHLLLQNGPTALTSDQVTATINVAHSLTSLGDAATALKLEEDLLLRIRREGSEGADATRVRLQLASTLRSIGDIERARLVEEPLWLAAAGTLADLPISQDVAESFALTLKASDHFAEARNVESKLLSALSGTLGTDHPRVVHCRANYALTLGSLEFYDDAQAIAQDNAEIARESLGGDHEATLYALMALAGVLVGRGLNTQGETLANSLLPRCREFLGAGHQTTSMVVGILDYVGQSL